MAILELFSKRKKKEARGEAPDVYRYNDIPEPLRVQIVHIWRDALGVPPQPDSFSGNATISTQVWRAIHNGMCREKGVFVLHRRSDDDFENCRAYITGARSVDDVLDIVEVSFLAITKTIPRFQPYEKQKAGIAMNADEAVEELNARFVEHAVGYQFENGQVLRVDRQFLHAEVVKPALALLHEPEFEAANREFMKAHEHYRAKNYKDAVVAAQRSFESTLKCICKGKGVTVPPGARASELIKAVRGADLFPSYLGPGFDAYVAALKTGLPDVRNNAGGHGAAPGAPPVPVYIAAYALHLTAANIVLCIEAYRAGR